MRITPAMGGYNLKDHLAMNKMRPPVRGVRYEDGVEKDVKYHPVCEPCSKKETCTEPCRKYEYCFKNQSITLGTRLFIIEEQPGWEDYEEGWE